MTTDERLDQILTRLDGIDKSLAELRAETRERLDAVNTRLNGIDQYLLGFRDEVINRLDIADGRIAALAALYQTMEPRLSVFTKAALDFGTIATRMQIEQSRIARLVEPAA